MSVEFAALLPQTVGDMGRPLQRVEVEDVMQWHRFEAARTMLPSDAQLGDLNWKQLVKSLICRAFENTGFRNGTYFVTGDLWTCIASRAGLLSPQDLMRYLVTWGKDDSYISDLLTGVRSTTKSAADLGGWLADYMNTVLRVAMYGARPDVKYVVVDNAAYQSVAQMTFSTVAHGWSPSSKVALGNIWETLAWHAYEKDRPEFVIGLLLVTMTRPISDISSSSSTAASAPPPPPPIDGVWGTSVQPPPPPPQAPSSPPHDTVWGTPVQQRPPTPPAASPQMPENGSRLHHSGGYWCLALVCWEHGCQARAFTPWTLKEADCYENARAIGWGRPSTKPWKHARCPQHTWTSGARKTTFPLLSKVIN